MGLSVLLAAPFASAAEPVGRVRVAFDRDGITASQAEGFADLAARRALTPDDPARVASVSKLMAAIGVLRLVDQGRLNLDADVSTVLGRPLRNPAFADTPITLKMLLSHTSGLTDNAGYWDVPLGESSRILTDKPEAWDSQHPPGSFFRYSNLNFVLIAEVMERATGERFDRLMQQLVFAPLKIDACHNWSGCSHTAIGRAVVLYDSARKPQRDDLKGQAPACPVIPGTDGGCDVDAHWQAGENGALFSPQGGVRISANGLARVGQMLLRGGELDGMRILSADAMRILTTPLWVFDGENGVIGEEDEPNRGGFFCAYGLASQHIGHGRGACRDDLFADGRKRIGHSGNAYGLLSGLWLDLAAGQGVAYFTTGVANDSSGQHSAFSRYEEQGATGW
ncbi:serine hydrolase [Lysobacteraceae bacterium NML120232]|nr:serine hydrolase [Xanthomonadaceae bacterium NML120232]